MYLIHQQLDRRPVDQLPPRTIVHDCSFMHHDDPVKTMQVIDIMGDANQSFTGKHFEQQVP